MPSMPSLLDAGEYCIVEGFKSHCERIWYMFRHDQKRRGRNGKSIAALILEVTCQRLNEEKAILQNSAAPVENDKKKDKGETPSDA